MLQPADAHGWSLDVQKRICVIMDVGCSLCLLSLIDGSCFDLDAVVTDGSTDHVD